MVESQTGTDLPQPGSDTNRHDKGKPKPILSTASKIDKSRMSQAKDLSRQTTANQHSFTAFSEYTGPPPAGPPKESIGITSDLHNGLSGLYTRLKESVSAANSTRRAREEDRDSVGPGTGDNKPKAQHNSIAASAQKTSARKARNLSPAPSQLSNILEPKVTRQDSPSIRPSKASSPRGSAVNSPTLQLEFKHEESGSRPKSTVLGGLPESVVATNEDVSDTLDRVPEVVPKHMENKNRDATQALYAADARLTRVKTDFEGQRTSLDRNSSDLADFLPLSQTPSRERAALRDDKHKQDERVASRSSGHTSSTAKQDHGQIRSKTNAQQKLQFLGLTHALDTADSTTIPSSRNQPNNEDDESLSSVGQLPFRRVKPNTAQTSGSMLTQVGNKLLSKEYWMRDENAKDCFYCGDSFSAFRRKHHCRICGQIFDAKCTKLVSGTPFGHSSTIRVCRPCEGMLNTYDDSSDFSDNGSIKSGFRTRLGSSSKHERSPAHSYSSSSAIARRESVSEGIPGIAIPTRRLTEDSKRSSLILEIDAEPRRPSSARSLKPSLLHRSHTTGHRRMNSKQSLRLSSKLAEDPLIVPNNEISARSRNQSHLSTHNNDNTNVFDMVDYSSDEDFSDHDHLHLADALHGNKFAESPRSGFAGLLGSARKRSHLNEVFTKDADTASLNSAKLGKNKALRKRNMSTSSNLNLKGSPRTHRYSILLQNGPHFGDGYNTTGLKHTESSATLSRSHAIMDESDKASPIELSPYSVQHIRRLLGQLLSGFDVPSKGSWEKTLMPIILKASHEVEQNVQGGENIDIRHYIKLKKIPGGRPSDSKVHSGIVFTKNVALKSMSDQIIQPNILILAFPLEYARRQGHFMSLEPVIRQEREYLSNLIHRIAALKPNLVLVEHTVSGLALEFLNEAGIATVYNVKRSVLEAISRMAQTRIITSIDKLAIVPAQAGRCGIFYLKTFMHEGRKKTCMFITGCPRRLGCTVVLRGSDEATLSKIKKICEFMFYVAYNLKLETSFLRDEFASQRASGSHATIFQDAEMQKEMAKLGKQVDPAGKAGVRESEKEEEGTKPDAGPEEASDVVTLRDALHVDDADELKLPEDTPLPTFYSDMMDRNQETVLSCSPCVKFMQPYLVVRAREQERRLVYLRSIRNREPEVTKEEKPSQFMLITPEMVMGSSQNAPSKIQEVIRAVQDAQYDKAMHNYKTQKKQWEVYAAGAQDMFSPFTHQNIVVLYSIVCASTSVPCMDPKLCTIQFYQGQDEDNGFEEDIPLGHYIESRCIEAQSICIENACESKMSDHRHQYVHATGQVSVTVMAYPPKVHGHQEVILMWSVCRICGEESQVAPMSENTWKYSWGKYLELSFWGHELYPQATSCNHDLHKDHFRYFGFQNMAVRFQYDNIALLEIVVPRTRITWKVSNDLKFKNEVFLKVESRINGFMNSVKNRLKGIHAESVVPERTEAFKEEISRLTNLANEHHTFLIEKLRAKYMGSKYYEIIPFNRAIRATEEKSVEWDNIFQELEQSFFPSERDIRRLATLQLKKIFLDRDYSVDSLSTDGGAVDTSMTSSVMTGQTSPDDLASLASPTTQTSSKDAQELMSSITENSLHSPEGEADVAPDQITPEQDVPVTKGSDSQNVFNEEAPTSDVETPRPTTGFAGLERTLSTQSNITERDHPEQDDDGATPLAENSGQLTEEPESMANDLDQPITAPQSNIQGEEPTTPSPSSAQGNENVKKRRGGFRSAIPLYRAQSGSDRLLRDFAFIGSGTASPMPGSSASNATSKRLGFTRKSSNAESKHSERSMSDRFGLGSLKTSLAQSMIPRSSAGRRKDSKVSELAKHFEALSREFERERRKDKQKATKARQFRAFPSAAAVPIIEEYRNFHEAVETERDQFEDPNEAHHPEGGAEIAEELVQANDPSDQPGESNIRAPQGRDEDAADETADETADDTAADTEADEPREDAVDDLHHKEQTPAVESNEQIAPKPHDGQNHIVEEDVSSVTAEGSELSLKLDLPKHEKSSLLKLLSNFWAERSASGWSPLEYPLHPTDHVFADSDIIVREDEPSSLIAFVLGSDAYKAKLRSIEAQHADVPVPEHEPFASDHFLTAEDQAHIHSSLLQSTGTHFKYQFQEGTAKMMCKVFFVEQFEAVRRKCGIDGRFIETLSRCLKWDSKGGKTKSVFLKTSDDRLVLKSLSPIETQSFVRFAPSYFRLMGEALFHDLPSVIAKMVGFYQIVIKNPTTGVDFNWFLLAMENLFYDRVPTRTFDLKGSMRNRRIQPTGEQNEVLLDENMVEYIFEKPLFAREHSKRLIGLSVFNDTLFLARQNVMDYSLMVAIDEERKELVVGIIDCVRTYTWDKKLESWMKDRGKNRPTVTSPKEYKNRFRAAMDRYVLQAPTCWHQFNFRNNTLRDSQDDERQNKDDAEAFDT